MPTTRRAVLLSRGSGSCAGSLWRTGQEAGQTGMATGKLLETAPPSHKARRRCSTGKVTDGSRRRCWCRHSRRRQAVSPVLPTFQTKTKSAASVSEMLQQTLKERPRRDELEVFFFLPPLPVLILVPYSDGLSIRQSGPRQSPAQERSRDIKQLCAICIGCNL